jgi:hypothetical protein
MARKGVLASDPTVRSMTRAQWLFEYHGLVKKDEEETDRAHKSLKHILIDVLGLNLKSAEKGKELSPEARFELNLTEFTPLVMLAGNHHLLKQYFKDVDTSDDLTGESKVSDADFEAQAQAIMDDMEPIDIPIAQMSVADIERIAQHRDLGIQDVDPFSHKDPIVTPLPIRPTTVIIRDGKE